MWEKVEKVLHRGSRKVMIAAEEVRKLVCINKIPSEADGEDVPESDPENDDDDEEERTPTERIFRFEQFEKVRFVSNTAPSN